MNKPITVLQTHFEPITVELDETEDVVIKQLHDNVIIDQTDVPALIDALRRITQSTTN